MAINTTTNPLVDAAGQPGGRTYRGPFAIMTVLFFMWGFLTVWNDILIPDFKDAFTLNYFQAMLIQFAFFGAYTVGSIVYYLISVIWGDPINRIGYKSGVIIGLWSAPQNWYHVI
jgi:MFS transporter, FHS family, L-fucose permease